MLIVPWPIISVTIRQMHCLLTAGRCGICVWHCGVAFQIWVCDYDMLLISSYDLVMSHVIGSSNALENYFADFMIYLELFGCNSCNLTCVVNVATIYFITM
jgi:hypothetical protein